MRQLTRREKWQCLFWSCMGIVLIGCLVAGCKSIQQQQKFIVYGYEEIEQVGQIAKNLVRSGDISEEDGEKIGELYDLAVDAYVIYAQALLSYQEHRSDADFITALDAARIDVAVKGTEFIQKAIKLGIEWRKR